MALYIIYIDIGTEVVAYCFVFFMSSWYLCNWSVVMLYRWLSLAVGLLSQFFSSLHSVQH